jgi:hypothetical protein
MRTLGALKWELACESSGQNMIYRTFGAASRVVSPPVSLGGKRRTAGTTARAVSA